MKKSAFQLEQRVAVSVDTDTKSMSKVRRGGEHCFAPHWITFAPDSAKDSKHINNTILKENLQLQSSKMQLSTFLLYRGRRILDTAVPL